MHARTCAIGLLTSIVALAPATPRAADAPATPVVTALNAALFDALKNSKTLGYKGRFDRLAPAVDQAFDLPFMAEKAVGTYWKSFDDAQRTRWLALFREFTIANYAGNLDGYSGEQRFEVGSEEPAANDTEIVHTQVINPPGENVELTYRLHQPAATWRIIDVYLKGTVSELALRRSDYTAVLEREGFDGLATSLRAKVDDLAAGRAKGTPPTP